MVYSKSNVLLWYKCDAYLGDWSSKQKWKHTESNYVCSAKDCEGLKRKLPVLGLLFVLKRKQMIEMQQFLFVNKAANGSLLYRGVVGIIDFWTTSN